MIAVFMFLHETIDQCYLRALTCQLIELNDDSDRSTMVVKSRDFSLDVEPVKTENYASPTKAPSTARTITQTIDYKPGRNHSPRSKVRPHVDA
jgi:hypothetical protein